MPSVLEELSGQLWDEPETEEETSGSFVNDVFNQEEADEKKAIEGTAKDKLLFEAYEKKMSRYGFFRGYFEMLHEPTPEAKVFSRDWLTRVVPESVWKTSAMIATVPYEMSKLLTDPLLDLWDDFQKEEQDPDAIEDYIADTGKGIYEMLDGFARFQMEPLGVYGKEAALSRWRSDPFGAVIGPLPMVKGTAKLTRFELQRKAYENIGKDWGEYSDSKAIRAVQQVYDKIDVKAPHMRAGGEATAIAAKTYLVPSAFERAKALDAASLMEVLKLDEVGGREVTLAAGRSVYAQSPMAPEIQRAVEINDAFYKEASQRAKEENIFDTEWPQSQLNAQDTRIEAINLDIEKTKKRITRERAKEKTRVRRIDEDTISKTKETKTTLTEDGVEAGVEPGKPVSRLAEAWEGKVKEAMINRGHTEGEANTAIEIIRGKPEAEGAAVLERIIRETTETTVKEERVINMVTEITKADMKKINKYIRNLVELGREKVALEKLNKQIRELDPGYVHIALSTLYAKARKVLGEGEFHRRVATMRGGRFFKQRKIIDIGEIITDLEQWKDGKGNPIYEAKDFDARTIMAEYAQRFGTIRGRARVFNAAYSDGFIIDAPVSGAEVTGFVEPNPSYLLTYPELKGRLIRKPFADYLEKFFGSIDKSMEINRFFGYTKITAFYNPIFLPMYDTYQAAWAGTFNPLKPGQTLGNYGKGFKSFYLRDAKYYEALDAGFRPMPFKPPFENFKRQMQNKILQETNAEQDIYAQGTESIEGIREKGKKPSQINR
jgi:hypothetical protein